MKRAVVTAKFVIENVWDDEQPADGSTIEEIVQWLIDEETNGWIVGLTDILPEIISIEIEEQK